MDWNWNWSFSTFKISFFSLWKLDFSSSRVAEHFHTSRSAFPPLPSRPSKPIDGWRELQDQACPKYLDGLRIVDFPTTKWKNTNHNSFHRKFFKDEMLLLYSSNIISCFLFIYFNILVKYAILYCLVYLNLCNLQRRNQCPRLQKIYLDDERCVYLFAFP